MVDIKQKKYHLIWETATKQILVDYETTNPRTVTVCTRKGVEGLGCNALAEYQTKIADEKLISIGRDVGDPALVAEEKKVEVLNERSL